MSLLGRSGTFGMWSGISSVMSCASVQKCPSARVEVKKSEKKISKIVGGK